MNANIERNAGMYGVLEYDRGQRSADYYGPVFQKEHALETHRAFVADLDTTMERGDWMAS